ncbi:protein-tyrosine phosphatase-like protein [Terfezia claveryi]|nr:protein-tyrosine phosphatase-like protein [Terfezia claveryi]
MEKTIQTTTEAEYIHVFKGIENFRDVGATINLFVGERVMREGFLLRSGRLDGATAEDKRIFKEVYDIKTVLDLRTDTERIVRFRGNPSADDESKTEAAVVEPIVAGLEIHRIRIIGWNLQKAMLKMLAWWSLLKVIVFMLFGFRSSAVKIISKEVIEKVGLVGMGTMTLEHSGNEIRKIFEILTSNNNPPYPVLAHCMQGKDRTGLVILLILLCLLPPSSSSSSSSSPPPPSSAKSQQVTLQAISHDYSLTQVGLLRVREDMIVEIVNDTGLPPSFINVDPGFVTAVVHFLQCNYGGIMGYLASLGLDADYVVCRLREILLVST